MANPLTHRISSHIKKIESSSNKQSNLQNITQACQFLFNDTEFTKFCFSQDLAKPQHEPYSRNLIYKSDFVEIMIARWKPITACLPHDHGISEGCVWLARGNFIETTYAFNENNLGKTKTIDVSEGTIIPVNQGEIHACSCDTDGLSVHIYWPSIHHMRVYDATKKRTLVVNDNCGAWIPNDHSAIVNEIPWKAKA